MAAARRGLRRAQRANGRQHVAGTGAYNPAGADPRGQTLTIQSSLFPVRNLDNKSAI
jgi:hypothetical protein